MVKIVPNVNKVLPKNIPEGFKLGDGLLHFTAEHNGFLEDGTRKLLVLNLSIAPDSFVERVNAGCLTDIEKSVEDNYGLICPHNCPGCFDKGGEKNFLLSFNEVKKIVDQGIKLGVKLVKFMGPGELFTNPRLFEILDYFDSKKVIFSIFTKGYITGDDELALKYQGMTSYELLRKVCSYDDVKLLVACRSFDSKKTGSVSEEDAERYSLARNKTIELMCELGMNKNLFNQRMTLQANPITHDNIEEVFELFEWGVERNIPVCITPTMASGKGHCLMAAAQTPEFKDQLKYLYTQIYSYLVKRGVVSLEQLQKEGISAYAGMVPCTVLSNGLFIRKDGVVFRCEGSDKSEFIVVDDIRKKSLREVWLNSANYKLGPVVNNSCVKDGCSIPKNLYATVLRTVVGDC